MKVNVEYNSYNSGIEKAVIPIGLDGEDEQFEISIVIPQKEVDGVFVEPADSIKRLELKAISPLSSEGISLQMTLEETKQFNLLLIQFLRQLG